MWYPSVGWTGKNHNVIRISHTLHIAQWKIILTRSSFNVKKGARNAPPPPSLAPVQARTVCMMFIVAVLSKKFDVGLKFLERVWARLVYWPQRQKSVGDKSGDFVGGGGGARNSWNKKIVKIKSGRSQRPRGLRRRSTAARLLGLWVRIPPGPWIFVCCECCVMSGRGLCDELITRPEESYRLWCVVMCDLETSWMRRPWPTGGSRTKNKQNKIWRNWLLRQKYSM